VQPRLQRLIGPAGKETETIALAVAVQRMQSAR
jgi:hypothetical protein